MIQLPPIPIAAAPTNSCRPYQWLPPILIVPPILTAAAYTRKGAGGSAGEGAPYTRKVACAAASAVALSRSNNTATPLPALSLGRRGRVGGSRVATRTCGGNVTAM